MPLAKLDSRARTSSGSGVAASLGRPATGPEGSAAAGGRFGSAVAGARFGSPEAVSPSTNAGTIGGGTGWSGYRMTARGGAADGIGSGGGPSNCPR
jgi:hypothetical protein